MISAGPLSLASEGFTVEQPTEADADFLAYRLEAFNTTHWPEHLPWSPVGIYRREDGAITAGLVGEAYAGLMFVKYLWVAERLRGGGLGTALLREAEHQAEARGCHLIWLDTFTFQAPGFYQKCGYEQFAALEAPPFQRLFLSKRLSPT